MNCEEISKKAIELGYTNKDFIIEKQFGNGWILKPLRDIDLTKIREYINNK